MSNPRDYGAIGKDIVTTGSIANGSDQLTVASATGLEVGGFVAVSGAGDLSGGLLSSKVLDIADNVLTIADNATHTVTDAAVKSDDAPAFQACSDAMMALGGGTVEVTDGDYPFCTPMKVRVIDSIQVPLVNFIGTGSGSRIICDVLYTQFCIEFQACAQVVNLMGIDFRGRILNPVSTDPVSCGAAVYCSGAIVNMSILRCGFNGIVGYRANILMYGGSLSVQKCNFGTGRGIQEGLISCEQATWHVLLEDCYWNDGVVVSPAFLYVADPGLYPAIGTNNATITVRRCLMGEVHDWAIKVKPVTEGLRWHNVLIEDCLFQGYDDVWLNSIDRVDIRRCNFTWKSMPKALVLENCKTSYIDNPIFNGRSPRQGYPAGNDWPFIYADADCDYVELRDVQDFTGKLTRFLDAKRVEIVEQGIRAVLKVAADPISQNRLVKLADGGKVTQLGSTELPRDLYGIALESTGIAYLNIGLVAGSAISAHQAIGLTDIDAVYKVFEFTFDTTQNMPGSILVNIATGDSAEDVAYALSGAINGAGLKLAATVIDSVVSVVSTEIGEEGNTVPLKAANWGGDISLPDFFTGGRKRIRVKELAA